MVAAVFLGACGSHRSVHDDPPPAKPAAVAAEPKRELMGASPLELGWDFTHSEWLATAAKPAATKQGETCRSRSESLIAAEFADALRTCLAACDGGDAPSCVIAAGWLMSATGNEVADRARAVELLDRACKSHDDPLACFILGEQLDRGPNVATHDPARAKAAWQAGCALHEDNSCAALRGERMEMETTEIYHAPDGANR